MGIVRRPMGVAGWVLVDIYAEYAQRIYRNRQEGHYFEAMAVALICLDVLLHHMVEGLLLHHRAKLDSTQTKALECLKRGYFTAGKIIDELENKRILDRRLIEALRELNKSRNTLVHPFAEGKLKRNAIVPVRGDSSDRASRVYRLLCHIIDIAGGKSPRKDERDLASYIRERRQTQRKKSRIAGQNPNQEPQRPPLR